MKNMQKDKYTALSTKSETTLRRLAKKYGYNKLPKTINNINYYGQRLSHFIEQQQYSNYEEVVAERNKRKPKKIKPKKESKRINLTKLIKEMQKTYNEYVNSIPEEYRKSEVFMNFFTKGHSLKGDSYDIPVYGPDFKIDKTVKGLMEHYQETDKQKLKELIKSQIEEMKNNSYEQQMSRLRKKANDELDRLEQELNDGMSTKISRELRNIIKMKQQYHELLELSLLLENNGNVFDSIYENDKLGGGQHDFDITINKVAQLSSIHKISDYKN